MNKWTADSSGNRKFTAFDKDLQSSSWSFLGQSNGWKYIPFVREQEYESRDVVVIPVFLKLDR